MGNNHVGGGGLLPSGNNGDGDGSSFHLQLGTYAFIDISTEEESRGDRGTMMARKASYTVDGSTCELRLIQLKKSFSNVSLSVVIRDDMFSPDEFSIYIDGDISGLKYSYSYLMQMSWLKSFDKVVSTKTNSVTSHPGWGGVTTETTLYMYGSESMGRGGLIVIEMNKRKEGWWFYRLYEITVAHYYAVKTTGNASNKIKTDIGLSMVVKIELLNDGGDFYVKSLEGPVQHPASALFYMFEQVFGTGIWKPTSCPHCARAHQRQSSGGMFGQNASLVANNGVFRGKNSGNVIVKNLFLGERS